LDKNVSGSLNLARNGGISLSSCSQYLLFIYLFICLLGKSRHFLL
jgi:hypothetical protein